MHRSLRGHPTLLVTQEAHLVVISTDFCLLEGATGAALSKRMPGPKSDVHAMQSTLADLLCLCIATLYRAHAALPSSESWMSTIVLNRPSFQARQDKELKSFSIERYRRAMLPMIKRAQEAEGRALARVFILILNLTNE